MILSNMVITEYNLALLAMPHKLIREVVESITKHQEQITLDEYLRCHGTVPAALRRWIRANIIKAEDGSLQHYRYTVMSTPESVTISDGRTGFVERCYEVRNRQLVNTFQLTRLPYHNEVVRRLQNEEAITVTSTNSLYPDAPIVFHRVAVGKNLFLSRMSARGAIHETRYCSQVHNDPVVFNATRVSNGVELYWDWCEHDHQSLIIVKNGTLHFLMKWAKDDAAAERVRAQLAAQVKSELFQNHVASYFRQFDKTSVKKPLF